MALVCLFVGLLLIGIGVLCYQFPNMISPYGGMSAERKASVDIEGMKYSLLWVSVVAGVACLLLALAAKFIAIHPKHVSWICPSVVVFYVVAVIVVMIRHNGFGGEGVVFRREKGHATKPIRVICLTGLAIVFLLSVLFVSNKPVKIDVADGVLHISGMYGREVPVESIITMEVLDEMPVMAMRINGSKFNKKSKGVFLTMDNEECLLLVTYNGGPYLELRTADKLIYLNRATPDATRALINELEVQNKKNGHGEGKRE